MFVDGFSFLNFINSDTYLFIVQYKQMTMLENQFNGIIDFKIPEGINVSQRTRQYTIKLKQKRLQIDDYDIKETIGQGGFGIVKKAIHKLTGQLVAVKIITFDQFDQQQIESIKKQIQLQKTLIHEHIAQIYQVIQKQNKIYIVMQYCKNGQLFDRLNNFGPLHEKQAAKIFNQILSALIYIKQNGFSHRDIKPENILFDQNWNAKLIDFGFSCITNGNFRKTVCGTPSYTPPEIIKRQNYDAQLADVWSLGVTLYVMLCAQLPFQAQTPDQRKLKILSCKYALKNSFSSKAQKLFSSIFVESRYRPHLKDLLTSQFALFYRSGQSNFINLKNQNIVLQESLINLIDNEYHIDPKKVIQSVKQCKLDKYHALYYLALKHQKHNIDRNQLKALSSFKKQRKGSNLKLQPINVCLSVPKRQKTFRNEKNGNLNTIDPNRRYDKEKNLQIRVMPRLSINPRLRKNSPDSPRRILDCVNAYKYS